MNPPTFSGSTCAYVLAFDHSEVDAARWELLPVGDIVYVASDSFCRRRSAV